jgi:uncharacterized membrane protein YccC
VSGIFGPFQLTLSTQDKARLQAVADATLRIAASLEAILAKLNAPAPPVELPPEDVAAIQASVDALKSASQRLQAAQDATNAPAPNPPPTP